VSYTYFDVVGQGYAIITISLRKYLFRANRKSVAIVLITLVTSHYLYGKL